MDVKKSKKEKREKKKSSKLWYCLSFKDNNNSPRGNAGARKGKERSLSEPRGVDFAFGIWAPCLPRSVS